MVTPFGPPGFGRKKSHRRPCGGINTRLSMADLDGQQVPRLAPLNRRRSPRRQTGGDPLPPMRNDKDTSPGHSRRGIPFPLTTSSKKQTRKRGVPAGTTDKIANVPAASCRSPTNRCRVQLIVRNKSTAIASSWMRPLPNDSKRFVWGRKSDQQKKRPGYHRYPTVLLKRHLTSRVRR